LVEIAMIKVAGARIVQRLILPPSFPHNKDYTI